MEGLPFLFRNPEAAASTCLVASRSRSLGRAVYPSAAPYRDHSQASEDHLDRTKALDTFVDLRKVVVAWRQCLVRQDPVLGQRAQVQPFRDPSVPFARAERRGQPQLRFACLS